MKKLTFSLFFLATTIAAFSQQTDTRKFTTFKKLSITGKTFVATIVKGTENKIELKSTDIPLDKILTYQEGDEIHLSVKGINTGNVNVIITYVEFPGTLEVNNNANLKSEETHDA